MKQSSKLKHLLLAMSVSILFGCGSKHVHNSRLLNASTQQHLDLNKILVESFSMSPSSSEILSNAQIHEDFQFVEYTLRNAYSGFEAQANLGMDWDKYFSETYARIDQKPKWTSKEFLDLLMELPRKFIDDGHLEIDLIESTEPLRVSGGTESHRWRSYRLSDAIADTNRHMSGCSIRSQQRIVKNQTLFNNGKKLNFDILLSREPVTAISCGERGDLLLSELTTSLPEFEKVFEEKLLPNSNVYYVRMAKFAPEDVDTAAAFIKSAENAGKYKKVILQLRGGGDPEILFRWLTALGLKGSFQTPPVSEVDSTSHSIALSTSALQQLDAMKNDTSPDALERISDLREIQSTAFTAAKTNILAGHFTEKSFKIIDPGTKRDLGNGSFNGSLVVIVDEECASACEEAVNVLKQLPGVTVLGVNTRGTNTYTEPLLILLPNSKIWYAAPSWIASMGENGGTAEGFGLTPSVWANGDLVSRALEIFRLN